MIIHHIAIWVKNLEEMKKFYTTFFNCKAGIKYYNPKKSFSSYFLSFSGGAKIELMHKESIQENKESDCFGYTHLAISVGSKKEVEQLTKKIESEGYTIKSYPRTTGDGYFESVICDPEGNLIEVTA